MTTLTAPLFQHTGRVQAKIVSLKIRSLLRETRVPERMIAQGLALGETYFSRMKNRGSGFYRWESLHPLERLGQVVQFAKTSLSKKGVQDWLLRPNAYLHQVPPILCLRTDEEMEKVISLLGAIRHGLPS